MAVSGAMPWWLNRDRLYWAISILALLAGCVALGANVAEQQWSKLESLSSTSDFSSYYYAVRVGAEGGNPYDTEALNEMSDAESGPRVHPFLYTPGFVPLMSWVLPLERSTAFRVFFLLNLIPLLAILLPLLWSRRPEGLLVFGFTLAFFFPLYRGQQQGQVNVWVLALLLWGILLAQRRGTHEQALRFAGGCLVGIACMVKMSPALIVLWWLVRRDWVEVLGACLTAVVLSLVALPLMPLEVQMDFYLRVLPGFAAGSYNGLTVAITWFGNHSVASFWADVFGSTHRLSSTARWLHRASSLLVLATAVLTTRKHLRGNLASLPAVVGVWCAAMLLIPVYTYEHHLIWALPTMVGAAFACTDDSFARLRWRIPMAVMVVLAIVILSLHFRETGRLLRSVPSWLRQGVREMKLCSLLLLGIICARSALKAKPAGTSSAPATVQ